MAVLAWLLVAIVAGALAYAVLVLLAARDFARQPARQASDLPCRDPISILKPLSGLDEGLEANLESFFFQDYPAFELIFAVRQADDPAVAVVETLRARHPGVTSKMVITGEPPYPNAKVYSLECMLAEARYGLLVMADSDTRVGPDLLQAISAEFGDPRLGLTTCPYRAVPGSDPWSTLDALGMNTEFLAGILVARLLEGMRFGVGPTMAARRQLIEQMGGFGRLKNYLAEDFVMGQLAAELGWKVGLTRYAIEHRIGTQTMRHNFAHRLRWNRSTRRSRPAGYLGQLFTYPIPWALLLVAVRPGWWPLAAVTLAVHAAGIRATSVRLLGGRMTARAWGLAGVAGLVSFGFWVGGLFGNSVGWRGQRYRLNRDGTFQRENV
jgi:ceramide glucosyltransferase